jgi:hypothetical protein
MFLLFVSTSFITHNGVDLNSTNTSRHFHITLGVGFNTRPEFSNTVLENNIGEFIKLHTTISGKLCKY